MGAAIATTESYAAPLHPREAEIVASAQPRRRAEFAAGRDCARRAMAELGWPRVSIPSGSDRAPVWPSGLIGSITHCEGFCCAVTAFSDQAAGIGVDAESDAPLTPEVERLVLTSEERHWGELSFKLVGDAWSKLTFSAKEAIYKCLHPMTRSPLGFQDISIMVSECGFRAEPTANAPSAAAFAREVEGRWFRDQERVYCGAAILRSCDH